ncbi:MAG: hypothetical protein P1U89_21485 [Verrucomicrobiales bacterium]|nr:hypothetical protein [Verrucomicrobiales bacterium]
MEKLPETISEFEIKPLNSLSSDKFEELQNLTDESVTVATLFLPMEVKGAETRKNHIVFKNALHEATEKLSEDEREHGRIGKMLRDLSFLDDSTEEFWQHQDKGLVMIVADNGKVTAIQTPFSLDPFVHVGPRPSLGRLLPLTDENRLYVLVLDLNKTRLFDVSRWCAREIALENVPTSLDEAMRYDDPEKSLQHHTAESATGGSPQNTMYHGHGITGDETRQKKIRRFFEMVNHDLASNFPDREVPLLLFGLETEIGHYRPVNSYPHLLDEAIVFNSTDLSDDKLKAKMLEAVEARAVKAHNESLKNLESQINRGNGTTDLREIVKGAETGRIDTLYVTKGSSQYGVYEAESNSVELEKDGESGKRSEDLVERAVLTTVRTGGRVHHTDRNELPSGVALAAIFRY